MHLVWASKALLSSPLPSLLSPSSPSCRGDRALVCPDLWLAWGTPEEIINSQLISTLYGVDVEVCSLHNDTIRMCVPTHIQK